MSREVGRIDYRIEDEHSSKHCRIEEIAREKDPEKTDEVLQYSHFDLADQSVLARSILLEKTQRPQLLEVVRGYARTTEIEGR